MQSLLTRSFHIVVAVGLLGYTAYLFVQGDLTIVGKTEIGKYVTLAMIALCAWFFVYVGVLGRMFDKPRQTYALLGVTLMAVGRFMIMDSYNAHAYLGDVMCIIGALTFVG